MDVQLYENIVQVENPECVYVAAQDLSHRPVKHARGIRQTKVENIAFIVAVLRGEHCFSLRCFTESNLAIARIEINRGKVSHKEEANKGQNNRRKRMNILVCDLIESPFNPELYCSSK